MSIHSRQFACHAEHGAVWKVVIDDTRTTASKVTMTLIAPNAKPLERVINGTRALLLVAGSTDGIGGYSLTPQGLAEMNQELVQAFLA